MIYRRFGWIHALLLQRKQDELRELEATLCESYKRDAKTKEGERYLQSRRRDETRKDLADRESRKILLGSIEDKTLQYGVFEVPVFC